MKLVLAGALLGLALLASIPFLAAAAVGMPLSSMAGEADAAGAGAPSGDGPAGGASGTSTTDGIPAQMLELYGRASASCPGLPWTVLAAIGTVESANGTSSLPGVHSGANPAGAEGPMQFLPATFAAYAFPVPGGGQNPPSPYDPTDAVFAAARDLCANGAAGGADLARAVFAYNHDARYVEQVLALADQDGQATGASSPGDEAGSIAAQWALAQVGTPYVWGGETVGVGFDCSGLVQAAYAAAGVHLPRVAQSQFDAGVQLAGGTVLAVGDLVFFGGGPDDISHVGMYVGLHDGQFLMVDAPHTGADVRVEAFPATTGAAWGSDIYVGATRPDR
jgi:cell wall-associated NlpC family hydrolase